MITRERRSQTLFLLFWSLLEVKAGFRVIPTKLFEKRPSSPVKTAESKSLLSKTYSRCGNTSKLFAFVGLIFAMFRSDYVHGKFEYNWYTRS